MPGLEISLGHSFFGHSNVYSGNECNFSPFYHFWELLSDKVAQENMVQHDIWCINYLFTTLLLCLKLISLLVSAVKTSFGSNKGHCSSGRWVVCEVVIVSETCVGGNKLCHCCNYSKTVRARKWVVKANKYSMSHW